MDLSLKSILKEHKGNIIKGGVWLFAIDVVGLLMPLLIKFSIDRLSDKPLPSWFPASLSQQGVVEFILSMCVTYVVFAAVVAYGRYWWRVYFIWGTFPIFDRVRRGLFHHLLGLNLEFFKKTKVGDMISSLSNDTENMRNVMAFGALMFVDSIFSFILFPALLFYLDPVLAMVLVPPMVLIALLAIPWSDRVSKFYDDVQDILGQLSSRAFEISSGVRVIKSFAREEPVHRAFVVKSAELRDASKKVARYESMYVPGLNFVLGLAVFVLLSFGGYRVISGELSLSSFIAFSLYLDKMDWPMMAMGWFIQTFRSARAAERRVLKLRETESPLRVDSRLASIQTSDVLTVEDVTYGFENQLPKVFSNLSFKLARGEWLGVTGSVGCGKTVLLELLSRQRDAESGQIFLNGRSLRSMSAEEIAGKVLYVPQETFLFSTSVKKNLSLGLADSLEDEHLLKLLEDLSFDLQVLDDRGGLETRLGERGMNLSGGQKQRLSLGRALLRDREVYLFDDLFSHVDVETESKLIEVLRRRIDQEASVILVSQRLETLKGCDRVLVLGEGGLEAIDIFAEALKNSPFLRALNELQTRSSVRKSRGAA
jgi:ATP-binding cassette subfamily B multidrug efflux pump